jgi:hypothetical protein
LDQEDMDRPEYFPNTLDQLDLALKDDSVQKFKSAIVEMDEYITNHLLEPEVQAVNEEFASKLYLGYLG